MSNLDGAAVLLEGLGALGFVLNPPFENSAIMIINNGLKLSIEELNPKFLAKESLIIGSYKFASFLKTYAV